MADAPWLRACKRLPIGGQARFRCCGRTPAGVLYNNPDAWEMWCHRCKTTERERKQFVQANVVEHQKPQVDLPEDAQNLHELAPELLNHIYTFLISKGIMPDMLPEDTQWTQSLKRILFRVGPSSWIGRSTSPHINPKWLTFGPAVQYAIAQPVSPAAVSEVVLTEDYLSALKLAYVSSKWGGSQKLPIALLGTRLSPTLKASLVSMSCPVLLMLDGDDAGYKGMATARLALRPFVPVREYSLPGKDPKDLMISQILEGFNGATH